MSDSHKPPLNADASRVHLCDCNRSFALDAARLSGSAGAALHCHHALCGAELPALEASLASGHTVHVACTQETALFGELAEARRVTGTGTVSQQGRIDWRYNIRATDR